MHGAHRHRQGAIIAVLCAAAVVCCGLTPTAIAAELYYSYRNGDVGGAARLKLDAATGKVLAHETIYESRAADRARKLAVTADGRYLILTNSRSDQANLFVTDLHSPDFRTTALEFPSEPDEVRIFGTHAVVGGDKGNLCVVDLTIPHIVSRWNSRGTLKPSGHKPEDILILPGQARAVVSFQKDTRGGKHFGSRVVVMELPTLRVVHDLLLPRNRPELHIPGSNRERGPNPEVVFASPETNTLFVSLDLYGAVALADLDAAVNDGRWSKLVYLPTAVDASWGDSFPDRMVRFATQGEEYVFVCNAGPKGGAAVVDLADRAITARVDCRFGLETPTYLPGLQSIVAAPAGKRKSRGAKELDEQSLPGRDVWLFDVSDLNERGQVKTETIELDTLVFRLAALDPEENALVCFLTGEKEPDTLVIYDLARRAALSRHPARGAMERTWMISGN